MAHGSGGSSVQIEDILVGDVWFGSGQSNMALTIDGVESEDKDPERRDKVLAAIVAGTHPMVRLHRGNRGWAISGPDVNRRFSSVMLSFGVALQRELDVPVGITVRAKIANAVTSFLSRQPFESAPACRAASESAANSPAAAREREQRDRLLAAWEEAARKARAAGEADPPQLRLTRVPGDLEGLMGESVIGHLNCMAIRGVLWDQGESGSGLAWSTSTRSWAP